MTTRTFFVGFQQYWSESAAKAEAKRLKIKEIYYHIEVDGREIGFGKTRVNELLPEIDNGFGAW